MVGTATLSVSPSTVTEGGTVTVTVTFTNGSFPSIGTVVLSEEHGEETGSIGGPDGNSLLYKEGLSGSSIVSLGTPGETTDSVELTVRNDERYSGDREVRIWAAMSGTVLGSAMLTVEDDEAKPTLVVAVDPPSRSVEEGDDFTLTVSITDRVLFANDQSLGLVLTGRTATSGADYEAPAATLTLAGGTSSATTTIATIEDTDVEGDETFALRVEHGGDILYDQALTIEDDDHPTVTSLDITSDPATDGNYTAGETVEVTVEFSREVAVTGAPRIPLQLGGPGMSGERFAGWSSSTATSTSTLVFTYPVVAADESHAGGISIEANSLNVNGGTISADGTTIAADLGHSAVAADGTHRVNYQPPSFVSVHTSSDGSEVIVTFSETLDTANAPAAERFTVKADGTALTLSGMPAISGHTVTLTLATAVTPGQTVTVSYTDPTAGDDEAAVQDEVGNDAEAFTDKTVGPAPATVTITAETGPVVVNAYHSADFTLERSGPTDAELQVTVAITQTAPYTFGNRSWSATFGAGSSQATLSVPVVGLGQGVLQNGTMTATVQSGEGYVVGSPGSAELSMLVLDPVMHIGFEQSTLNVDEDAGRATVELVATSVEGAPAPNDDYPIVVTLSTMLSIPSDNAATSADDYVHITDEFKFSASDFQLENERWVARIQVGTAILDDELHEGDETFVYRLARSGRLGGAIQILDPETITVTIVDDDPPEVESVALTSTPGGDATYYAIGDTVEATVTFLGAVTVDTTGGRPGLELDFDGTAKPAAYDSGSGSTALVFTYQVAENDADDNGIAIAANRLTLDGGTISASTDSAMGAVLTHAAVPADAAHRVDGVRPTLSRAATASDGASIVLTFSEPLDEDNGPSDTDFMVNVDGSAATLSGPPAVSGGTVTLTLAAAVTAGQAVTVGNDADSFSGEAVTNTIVPASNDATLRTLAVSDGGAAVPLTPAFDPATTVYNASVTNAVATVTVTATANDENAEVAFLDEGGAALPDADRNTSEHQVTLDVGDNLIQARVTAENSATTTTYTVTVTRRVAAPAVVSVALTSDPDAAGPDDDTYAIDDVVRATVTFSAAVTVDTTGGRPGLELDFDGTAKPAAYDSGSGSTALVFTYEVAENDADDNGIAIAANRLTLNRGTITALSDTLVDAVLTHPAVSADAGHRVDAVRPTLTGASVDRRELTLTWSEALNEDSAPGGEAFTIHVTGGTAPIVTDVSVSEMTATLFLSGPVSSTDTVTLDYVPPIPNPFQEVQETLPFEDEAGNDAEAFTARTVTNDTSPPAVVSVALTSDPDATGPDDDTYAIDDVVRATVTFSEAVTVDTTGGRPGLELDFDGTAKPAAYDSGSGSTALVFTYQVAENDADPDGIAIGANRLTLNGGTLTALSDTLVDAVLTHAAVPAAAGHRVDAVRPTLTGASVNRRELTLIWSEALNEGSTPQGLAFTVHVTGGTAPSVTDVSLSGMTATLVLSAPVSSTDTVTLDYTPPLSNPFEDEAGNDAEAFTARTVTNDTSAPAVVSVALTSDPDATGPDDDTYAIDDVVRATVTFSEAVTVFSSDMTGERPGLELDFNGTAKPAAYDSGSGSTALVFRYQVAENDADADGIAIAANRLTLNGGTLTASSDTLVDAVLTHAAVLAAAGHRVDGVRPTLSSAATASDGASIVLTLSEPLDEDNGPSDTDFTVNVDSSAAALSGPPAVSGRTVTLTLATAVTFGQAVTVGYTDPAAGDDANALQDTVGNDADSFIGEAVTNAVPASNDATLRTLAVSDAGAAVPLTPAFDPATTVYNASVTNAVATVTVTATANDEDAEVAFLDEDGADLPDADGNTLEHQVTLDVGDNLILARVTAENSASTTTYTVTVTRRVAAPAVVSVALTSDPDATGPDDDTYAIDDVVRATVTFSAAVTVDTTGGRPGLELDFDGTAKPAAYDSGSGSTALVFTYQVAEDDADDNGIAIAANRLTLNRGTITASSDTLVDAVLTHAAVPADAGHRVDAVRPTLTGASVDRRELILTWSEALNEDSAPGGEAFTVHVTGGTAPIVTDVSVSGMTATLVLSGPVSSTDTVTLDYVPPIPEPLQEVQETLPFEDEAGNDAEAFTARTVTNDTSAPAVVSVALTSDPDATGPDDDTYAIDDVVRATVTFSEAVTVDTTGGRPGLELDFDGTAKPAAYDSGSGSTALVFTYQVAENDADPDGIAIGANRLTLNGGTISALSDTLVDAVLTHAAVSAAAAHRVDGVRPTLSSAATATDGASIVLTLSEPLDEDNGPSDTDFTVNVDGSAAALSGPPTVSGRTVTLTLATAVTFGQAVTVGYTDPAAGNDANALHDTAGNDADSFTGEAVANAVPASNDATLRTLAVSDGGTAVPLTPVFDPATTVYRASVTNAVATVTVTATANDEDAEVAFLDEGGAALPDADRNTPEHQVTLDVGDNLIQARVTAENSATTTTYTVTVTRRVAAPAVVSVALTSDPDATGPDDDTYAIDDMVRATVTFSAAVTVDTTGGRPGLELDFDGTAKPAAYDSGSGSTALVFTYQVAEDDADADGIAIAANRLTLNRGTITASSDTLVDAVLTHPAVPAQPAHRVDGVRPALTGASVNRRELTLTWSEALNEGSTPGGEAFTVHVTGGTAPSVTDVSVRGMAATLVLSAPVSSTDTVTLDYTPPLSNPFEDEAGNDAGAFTARTVTNDTSPPAVVSVALTSDPDATGPDDDTYAIDDVVRATVTFSEAVTVDTTGGRPGLELDFNGTAKPAAYDSGSGSTALVFTYQVAENDADADGIAIAANRLTLNLGTITASSDTLVGAVLTHAAVPAQAAHRVDGVRPTLSSAASASDGASIVLTLSEPLDEDNGPSDTDFTVNVDGSAAALSGPPAVSGRTATLTLATAVTFGQAVTVGYTDPTAGNDANALQDTVGNDADSFTGEAVANAVPASNDATLRTLAVSDGGTAVPLTPVFDSATGVYNASVTNAAATVTVTVTPNDEDAEVAFLDEHGAALPDADRNTPEHQVTLEVGDNTIQVRVTAEDSATTATYTVTVTRRVAAPAVVSVALTSDPDATGPDDDTYAIDDVVRATVTFSAAVTVDTTGGRPGLELDFNGTAKPAAYDSGSGSTALVFTYQVAENDADADGIAIAANRLTLNLGTISASSDTLVGRGAHPRRGARPGRAPGGRGAPDPVERRDRERRREHRPHFQRAAR